jgi:integrase/recombinase XerD
MPGYAEPDLERVQGAIEEFFITRATRKPSAHTVAAYRRDLDEISRLAAQVCGVEVAELRTAALTGSVLRRAFAGYAASRSAASVIRTWSAWNQFFTFLVGEGAIGGNPMPAVDRPRPPRREPKPLKGEDTPERVLAAVLGGARRARDPWPELDLVVIAVPMLAGLRLGELLGLRLDSLTGRAGERVLHVRGKGDKPRSVPIEPALEHLLALYLDSRRVRFGHERLAASAPLLVDRRDQPMRRGALQYIVRRSFADAGLGDRVPRGALVHALRHTFATRLAEDGATASEIMRLLGHASITTSQGYIDATAREQREAVRASRTYRALEDLLAD